MPRIPNNHLNCAVYLYPTERDAADGERIGGSGFLVSQDSTHPGYHFVYVVTNSHVIREGKSPVIRVNTKDGKFAVLPLDADDWVHHEDGDDLAAATAIPLTKAHLYSTVPRESFLTKEIIDKYGIGPGDETFMIGRFVSHEGRQKNLPSVRFGAIAQMSEEPIKHERGFLQESFLVEARSIPGYSGSPVFVWIMPLVPRPVPWPAEPGSGISHGVPGAGPWFMGVDWAHLPLKLAVLDEDGDETDYWVEANTGMMGVIPAWKVAELLDQDEFKQRRAEGEKEIALAKAASPAVLDDSGSAGTRP